MGGSAKKIYKADDSAWCGADGGGSSLRPIHRKIRDGWGTPVGQCGIHRWFTGEAAAFAF
jgi:hypothetical protein